MSDTGYGDFEFERRFFVRTPPAELLSEPDPVLIVQSYYLAQDGYALRLRVQASGVRLPLGPDADPLAVLEEVGDRFEFCAVTLKGPMNVGTRYEAEREIDVTVGTEMIRRGGHRIVKNRYSVWLGADGWVVDVFGGANAPLVIAECERSGPVTDVLAQQVGGVVVVVGAQKVRTTDLEKSLRSLEMVEADLLGLVLNRLPSKGPDAYSYNYKSYENSRSMAAASADSKAVTSPAGSTLDFDEIIRGESPSASVLRNGAGRERSAR